MARQIAKPVLLLVCGAVPTRFGLKEDFGQMFLRAGRLKPQEVLVFEAWKKVPPKNLEDFSSLIITGSLSMVTERPKWSLKLADRLLEAQAKGLPILGVCYGHQLMAQAMGGEVGYRPDGPEIGAHLVTLTPEARLSPTVSRLPAQFLANLSHSQSVKRPPAQAKVLAFSAGDPFQILSYGELSLSCQFHPEFDQEIMTCFLSNHLKSSKRKGASKGAVGTPIAPTPAASSLVRLFLDSVRDGER
jgi:GMP synthase (glutamine-hydrolysing)